MYKRTPETNIPVELRFLENAVFRHSPETAIPARKRSLSPVAVTTMSAASSLPDFKRMPVSVKVSIWSVTTLACPERIAANLSLIHISEPTRPH